LLDAITDGVVIWTDFDRLNRGEIINSVEVYQQLSASRPAITHLNDPAKSLRRFELMRSLHTAGINSFNVFRLDEASKIKRYPVFIRNESGVSKKAPKLYRNIDELNSALVSIRASEEERADLMIVEFLNAVGHDGYFRKYGAYRVGDRIYAQHVFFAR